MRVLRKTQLIISLALIICLIFPNFVFASNVTTSPSIPAITDVLLTSVPAQFNVTLPLGLVVAVQSDGSVVTASDAYIENNSLGPIEINNVKVETVDDWELVNYGTEFYDVPVGTKQFAFKLNNEEVSTSGKIDLSSTNWPVIYQEDKLNISYDAEVPAFTVSDSYLKMADVVFTIDYWDGKEAVVVETLVPKVSLSSEEASYLWEWRVSEDESYITITKYLGEIDGQDVIVPTYIDGIRVTTIEDVTDGGTATDSAGSYIVSETSNTFNSFSVPQGITIKAWGLDGMGGGKLVIDDDCVIEAYGCAMPCVENLIIGRNVGLNIASFEGIDFRGNRYYEDITNLYIDTNIPDMQFSHGHIDTITFGEHVYSIGNEAFGWYRAGDYGGEYHLSIQKVNGLENVSVIGEAAFGHLKDVGGSGSLIGGDITIKDGAVIGAGAFIGCNIDNITIGENVTISENAFYYTKITGTIYIGSKTSLARNSLGIKSADTMEICDNISLSNSPFRNVNDTLDIYEDEINTLIVDTDIPDKCFLPLSSINNIILKENVNSIGINAFGIGAGKIKSIKGVENVAYIGTGAFAYGTNYSYSVFALEDGATLNIGKGAVVDKYAFSNLTVDTLNIADDVAINSYAFYNMTCSTLTVGQGVAFAQYCFGSSTSNSSSSDIVNANINSNLTLNSLKYTYITNLFMGDNVNFIDSSAISSSYITGTVSLNKKLESAKSYFSSATVTIRE